MAKAYVFRHSEIYISHEMAEDRDAALALFEAAYRKTHSDIDAIEASGEDEKALLAVYKAMLEDPDYLLLIRSNIKERGYNAAWAVEASAVRRHRVPSRHRWRAVSKAHRASKEWRH